VPSAAKYEQHYIPHVASLFVVFACSHDVFDDTEEVLMLVSGTRTSSTCTTSIVCTRVPGTTAARVPVVPGSST
jgi:hypothetical protein